MERGLIYRIVLVAAVVVIAGLLLVPTVMYDYGENKSELPEWWTGSNVLPINSLVLGLDLQGGMDLLVSVDADEAVVNELTYLEGALEDYFGDEDVGFTRVDTDPRDKKLHINFDDGDSMRKGTSIIQRNFQSLALVSGKDELEQVYKIRDAERNRILQRTVEQVREILARRMDAYGLREPEIVIQGDNAIRLQLPGVRDPERIKEMVHRSAKLEFMLVEAVGLKKKAAEEQAQGTPPGMVLASYADPRDPGHVVECYFSEGSPVTSGQVPINKRLVPAAPDAPEEERDGCYYVSEDHKVSGKDLKDARPGYESDGMSNYMSVNFEFNIQGAQAFSKLTGDNVGERLAIVLEDHVVSAPVVQSRIFSRGQITGRFTAEDATDLANVLKSGALEVGIKIEEERTVGASLGADSIHKGQVAIFWGFLLVVVFMILYYRGAGIIADTALVLNLFFIMAALSMFGATLTLPGLAGIVLTVGMAVDANVLIFERVREELRTGKTPAAAIDAGYAKALWTILDANITTLIAALVLLQWGTGPIKGFAVTLTLGIISSMFTAIVVTRVIYDTISTYRKSKKLSIGIDYEVATGRARNK